MEIENTPLYTEIREIIDAGVKPVHYSYQAVFYPAGDGGAYTSMQVLELDNVRNFRSSTAAVAMLKVIMAAGTYAYRIYPYKDNIEVSISKGSMQEIGLINSDNIPSEHQRFKAILVDRGSPNLARNGSAQYSEEAMNRSDVVELVFQLVPEIVLKASKTEIGEIVRQTTPGDAVRTLLTLGIKSLSVSGGNTIKGIDMVEPNNRSVQEHIILPQGDVRLVDVPGYVQERCAGLYSAGLGSFIQDDFWYIYPLFDTSRFDSAKHSVLIIVVPENRFPQIERTYRLDGDNLVILCTGTIAMKDISSVNQLNEGNGVRFADANQWFGGSTVTVDNKTFMSRGDLNTEMIAQTRSDGLSYSPVSESRITANKFREFSKLAAQQGGVVQVSWQNSKPSLIKPGSMARMHYFEGGRIKQLDGVIHGAHDYTHLQGQGLTSKRYMTNTALSLFVKGAVSS